MSRSKKLHWKLFTSCLLWVALVQMAVIIMPAVQAAAPVTALASPRMQCSPAIMALKS
jgi:hypothetical protein